MFTIALDLGSTNLKAALFNEQNIRLADRSITVRYSVWQAGRVEMDAAQIWEQILDLCQSLCQAAGLHPSKATHLAISSQAQTFVVVDNTRQPLTLLISWIDTRASPLVNEVQPRLEKDFHLHCSFPQVLPELMLMKVFWLKKNDRRILDRAQWVLPFPSWLAMKMGSPAHVDHNLAAMSGLYSLKNKDWWDESLGLCEIDKSKMPKLIHGPVSCNPPDRSQDNPFSFQTVHIAGNDQTCGALACQLQENELLLTLGTTLVAYRRAGMSAGPYNPGGCWGPYPAGGFYELVALSPSTSNFDLFEVQPALKEDLQSLAIPFTRSELLCFELFRLVAATWNLPEIPQKIMVAGGGSQDDTMLQMLSNLLARPVHRTKADALSGAVIQTQPDLPDRTALIMKTIIPNPGATDQILHRYSLWEKAQAAASSRNSNLE